MEIYLVLNYLLCSVSSVLASENVHYFVRYAYKYYAAGIVAGTVLLTPELAPQSCSVALSP